jgi:hypothetical protein
MAYELKDNSGSLFKNDKKTEEKHPSMRGECMVNGKKMSVSAWVKEGKNGNFLSLSFQEPWVKPENKEEPAKQPAKSSFDNFDDGLPW